MLVPFVGLNFCTLISKKRFISIGLKGIYHTIGAGAAAFLGSIIFNPFHLTNLTHTFIISLSKNAEMWRNVNEWHPAFEWKNPVGDEIPFLIMYIIAWLVLVAWIPILIITIRASSIAETKRRKKEEAVEGGYEWPKVDLALMAIAALTIYMAIRSRRFIPIAGIAACPVIAMLIDQAVRSISAAINFNKSGKAFVSAMPGYLQKGFTIAGAIAVVYFGTWWGLKYKRIYLDPWPLDSKLSSVFIRMTASDAKPFYACQFIRDNKMEGKMFNYWTEGGFIGYGQTPDPNSGKTPLKLFMDGRAQAAYEPAAYKLWSNIMAGGPTMNNARIRGVKLGTKEYMEMGKWIGGELRKRNVWAILMPSGRNTASFVAGIEHNANWPLVYMDNRQKLFVDMKSPRGEKLFNGIFIEGSDKTIYPDEFTRNLIMGRTLMTYGKNEDFRKQGLEYAIKAFEIDPSPTVTQIIIMNANKFAYLRERVAEFCKNYSDEFVEKKEEWKKLNGYHNKLAAAINTCEFLRKYSEVKKKPELAKEYAERIKAYSKERGLLIQGKRW
jgi:hypothetical protein